MHDAHQIPANIQFHTSQHYGASRSPRVHRYSTLQTLSSARTAWATSLGAHDCCPVDPARLFSNGDRLQTLRLPDTSLVGFYRPTNHWKLANRCTSSRCSIKGQTRRVSQKNESPVISQIFPALPDSSWCWDWRATLAVGFARPGWPSCAPPSNWQLTNTTSDDRLKWFRLL